jgi:hypothetical protein
MIKRLAVLAALAGAALLLAGLILRHQAVAATSHVPGTFVAVLPEIGTVYSRYDCNHGWRFALGINVFSGSQTTGVRFRAGRFSRERTLQPGDPTSWFRYSTRRVLWVAAAADGEDGTVVGWVRVVGYPSSGPNCAPYTPPRVTIQIYPRRYYYARGDLLCRFIG